MRSTANFKQTALYDEKNYVVFLIVYPLVRNKTQYPSSMRRFVKGKFLKIISFSAFADL